LAVEGFETVSAPDLKSSFDSLSKKSFAAVLLDISLGNEDGLAIVAWMRQRPEVPRDPGDCRYRARFGNRPGADPSSWL